LPCAIERCEGFDHRPVIETSLEVTYRPKSRAIR
jgi:hypothetical protein